MNIGDWVRKWALAQPQKLALICEEANYTYQHTNARVNQVANLLDEIGIKKEERIAVLSYNSNQLIEVCFAAAKMGIIVVPLNFRLAEQEMEFILNHSGSRTLVFDESFKDLVASLKAKVADRHARYLCVGKGVPGWAINYEKEIEKMPVTEPVARPHAGGEDAHMIMYTSGTTGLPKGIILSHRKTFFNVLNADIYYGLTPNDILLVTRALFHSGGLLVEALPTLYKGGTIIIRKKFRPLEILEAIERYRVTVLEAPATLFKFILEQCDMEKYDMSSLRCCFTGGERVPPSLIRGYQKRGISISQLYGQTETSTVTWLPPREAARKIGSVGIPVFHGDVRIVNAEGRKVKPGEVGEIIVSGPILMTGYWKKDSLTGETIKEGWLYTGDLAKTDEDGFFYIVDRKKDMFISGGENIYPAEVEKVFLEDPRISDAAVIGIGDEKWGEVGKAFIVLREGEKMTEEEALDVCAGRIGKYKIPKSVEFMAELPKTAAQKIMRYKLREIAGEKRSGTSERSS
jgi:fatty-acyl-CoA synthase